MRAFEAIRDSGLFSGWTFAIALGVLLLVCVAIGKREKPQLRGSGKFAGRTQMIRKYGDWSRLPLTLRGSADICLPRSIPGAVLYSIWGWEGFSGRV